MTIDISFGIIETVHEDNEEYQIVTWPGDPIEEDGTSFKHTIFCGKPVRSFSIGGFDDFIGEVPEAYDLLLTCKPLRAHTDDPETAYVKDVIHLIDKLPEKVDSKIHQDSINWFKYWARRSLEEFGDEAAIQFS